MQLSQFLKVPVTYFYEEYRDYKNIQSSNSTDNLNFSYLSKIFSTLSKEDKDRIFQVLTNTDTFDSKTG